MPRSPGFVLCALTASLNCLSFIFFSPVDGFVVFLKNPLILYMHVLLCGYVLMNAHTLRGQKGASDPGSWSDG